MFYKTNISNQAAFLTIGWAFFFRLCSTQLLSLPKLCIFPHLQRLISELVLLVRVFNCAFLQLLLLPLLLLLLYSNNDMDFSCIQPTFVSSAASSTIAHKRKLLRSSFNCHCSHLAIVLYSLHCWYWQWICAPNRIFQSDPPGRTEQKGCESIRLWIFIYGNCVGPVVWYANAGNRIRM